MGRPALSPTNALGAAIRARRSAAGQTATAADIGVARTTLAQIERGEFTPSINTALALARWLGWSVEQVIEAARTPATPPPSETP